MKTEALRTHICEACRNRTFLAGFLILASVVVAALFAERIALRPYDEINVREKLQPPSASHFFGTDHLGRDLFSRVIHGSRITLKIGVIAVTIQVLLGVTLGLLAGFYGGWRDKVILFFTDATWALPPTILAIAICAVLGPGLTNVIIAVALVSWARFTRVIRAKTQSIKNLPFIESARAFGENDAALLFRYIFPNVVPVTIVLATLSLPATIITTTALGFLGLGAQPPSPDWGVILSDGMTYMTRAPWLSVFPGLAIIYVVLGFNLIGEGLRDLLDPRLKI